MATHSSILAWRIPWTEEPGGLQSTGSQESDKTERLHFHFLFFTAKSLQSCPTLCNPIDGSLRGLPTRLPCPWGSPGKNTGVGCHFLLQCMKVKGESEVTQLCPTLSDPMDCSLPGSSVHGIFQARVLEWGASVLREQPPPHPATPDPCSSSVTSCKESIVWWLSCPALLGPRGL